MNSQSASSPIQTPATSHDDFSVATSIGHLAYSMPGALATLASNGDWRYARHLAYIEDRLLDVVSGKINRLAISVPPQNGKSQLISHYFPAWYLGRFPKKRILLASYESTFAASWGRRARDVLAEYGEDIFGVSVRQGSAAANYWETDQGGYMSTAGAGGATTGRGAEIFILDDPIKNAVEALSSGHQKKLMDWFRSVVYTRLAPDAAIVFIMTRWSHEDLLGQLLTAQEHGGDQWTYVNLPAICVEKDVLGREPGEALWPERYPLEWLEQRRRVLQDFWFGAMYQGNPTPREGFIINVEWFRRYRDPPDRASADQVVLSLDTAQKEAEINDYTVCTVWFIKDNAYYLVDVVRDRYDHPKLLTMAGVLYDRWRPNVILIEDRGSGTSLIQTLRGKAPVQGVEPTGGGDKVMRMQVESPAIEGGQVHLPMDGDNPWIGTYLEEMRGFPNIPHKDQVDSTSQFLRWARERSSGILMW